MPRNTVISIAKGIAITLMVVGHAEAPELVTNLIYTFHMPLFFITAGYFFTPRHAADPWEFCRRRFKGLYVPFLKWSLLFLVLHNLFFAVGLLNEQYGNWTGGVTHPYDRHAFAARLLAIVTSMSGYDEFMAGAFWFFRGLLVASIAFLVLYRLVDGKTALHGRRAALAICLAMVALNAFRFSNGLKLSYIPNGGLRETWGIFFFGLGVVFRAAEPHLRRYSAAGWVCLAVICVAARLHLSGMNNSGTLRDLWSLPLTGSAGFLMTYFASVYIDRSRLTALRRVLIFLGENTLYILVFHIISFKLVSAVKIMWYGLDWGQIGCHMVIHYNHTDFFWIIYSIVGTALPAAGIYLVRRRRERAKAGAQESPGRELTPTDAL